MSDDAPRSLMRRLFIGALLVLGSAIALKLAFDLLATFWGWLVLAVAVVALVWVAIILLRYWCERRW